MRFRIVPALALFALIVGCVDQPTVVPPPDPEPPAPPLGVYRITVTGIGSSSPSASAIPITEDGPARSLSPAPSGLALESVSTSSFVEGSRASGQDGQRYVSATFRVRNSTGGPVSNVTFIPVSSGSTITGTPFLSLRKLDNTVANPALAPRFVPTGAVALGSSLEMLALYPDVIQVFEESEVAAFSLPAGKTGIFPYGFVIRNATAVSRTLPPATGPNDFGGMLTVTYRFPLALTAAEDVFSFVFDAIAVQDTELRMTESIEEAQDTAAVRRIRERASALGATTVTVLNGSGRMDPAVANYPGQRQICSARTAGTPGSPVATIVEPAAYTTLAMYLDGENDNPCDAHFRTGAAARPATNVAFRVRARAKDRYGNTKTPADTVRLVPSPTSPPATVETPKPLSGGSRVLYVTYHDYGVSGLNVVGRRNTGIRTIPIAGVTRTWTAGAGTTDWHTGANWGMGAVPMSLDSVLVPTAPTGGAIFPVLAANVNVMGVTVENSATLSLGPFDLTAGGSVATGTSGGIDGTSGRLVLTGIARTVRGVVPRVRVFGSYSLDGNLTARAPLRVETGRLRSGSFRIRSSSF
jgi:hypothetical protein